MSELRRLQYLEAMGIESYVSRQQLPGAAVTQRLAIVPRVPPVDAIANSAKSAPPFAEPVTGKGQRPAADMSIETPDIQTRGAASAPVALGNTPVQNAPINFSLAAIACGGWLWLESLEGSPILPAQLQLVQSMTYALQASGKVSGAVQRKAGGAQVNTAQVTQFDWPMHNNQQLDQSRAAARASVAAFVQRRLDVLGGGLVLLGSNCAALVPVEQLECCGIARTVSTAEMLEQPLLKRRAWQDLLALIGPL